ncbi:SAM hydrolase/SAM-dependent halogenase family protein [Jidongwangia harbinensis]|uniref:SAM hydrolase/SAM-dependent halogenase family protein n=1 Tax=Jidongwangia harbinensis TaxID=2878561 RepID=UPI001CD97F26|nr:SAM-dependent chlorinase/fluorinase [Jidongwangia harbinensis]MCA2215262.1 SAM-dependent chlorinase/fluorinase [Jidongwangia harbinensis]
MGGYGWISLTTDYGTFDGFVAACHGSIARIAPEVRVIDVTHHVPPADVARGAAVLAQTAPHLPASVHCAVVDPGVGTDRRGIAIGTPDGVLVGPDNGLLVWAAEALGGLATVVELTNPDWFLSGVSRTFHGRDVFAPAAARIAAGAPLADAGPPVDPETVVRLPDPVVTVADGWIESEVMTVDRFGNVQLAAPGDVLAGLGADLLVNGNVRARRGSTFADVDRGDLLVYEDSAGRVAIAVNNGRAVVVLSVRPGDLVRLTPREPA